MGVFHSASIRCIERDASELDQDAQKTSHHARFESLVPTGEWVQAVIKGADEQSPRANHLLMLAGMLIGFGSRDEDFLTSQLGITLQSAFVKAVNLALTEPSSADEVFQGRIVLAVNHAFSHLSDFERTNIDYDHLLPALMNCSLHSYDGLRSGYFIGAADADVQQISGNQFDWPRTCTSYRHTEAILSSPLISTLGPLSRLIAHSIEQVQDSWLVVSVVEDIADFSRRLLVQWRQNKLSEIDVSEETVFLSEEARQNTLPTLWRLLRSTLFALVIILRSVVGRTVGDGVLATDDNAPHIAQEALHSLRNLSFVLARIGSVAFSQYTFTYLAAIDILANYPVETESFLQTVAPSEIGGIPRHPLDRCLDLFFLNAAEHFTLVVSPKLNEDLLIPAAGPYLVAGGNTNLLPIFEAAHSVMLAVFSAPQNVDITAHHLPFYVDALFKVFPDNLSPRQFRLAFKNLIRVVSPPSRIAGAQPLLAAILLDLVRERALQAPQSPLPTTTTGVQSPLPDSGDSVIPLHSEQAVLISTLTDVLPAIALDLLHEWLPLTAELIEHVSDAAMREDCKRHFWDTLVGGEMDPERSQICVAWWTSRGGREMLLHGDQPAREEYTMSGALPEEKSAAKL
ncbi:hypothetical protein MBLNU459_g4962t1 [Dothideomycetes sp. NU459]